jgi:hypothetical protein
MLVDPLPRLPGDWISACAPCSRATSMRFTEIQTGVSRYGFLNLASTTASPLSDEVRRRPEQ